MPVQRSEIQCTSGLNAAILFSGCRQMSVNVGDATVELGMVENMGVAIGISLITCPEKLLCTFIRKWPIFVVFSQFWPPF